MRIAFKPVERAAETPDVLVHAVRPAAQEPSGLLVLHHGRGTDERDLLSLADLLDPDGHLHVVAPRAPIQLEGSPGYHWYVVRRVGYPDPETFHASYARLSAFHDALFEAMAVPPERAILGGFSMGSVMSYATGIGPGRPRPAGILAFSGFVPTVEGWEPDFASRAGLPVLIAHGRLDPVITVEFGRQARGMLENASLAVEYLESDVAHSVDPAHLAEARRWIAGVLPFPL